MVAAALLGLAPAYGAALAGTNLATLAVDESNDTWPLELTIAFYVITSPLIGVAALLVRRGRPLGSLAAGLVGSLYLLGLWSLALAQTSVVPSWPRIAGLAVLGLAGLTYVLGLVAIPGHGTAASRLTVWPMLVATLAVAAALRLASADRSAVVFLAAVAAYLLVLALAARRGSRAKPVLIAGAAVVVPYALVMLGAALAYGAPAWLSVVIAAVAVCAAAPLIAGLVRLAAAPTAAPADDRPAAPATALAGGGAPAALIAASMAAGPIITLLAPPAIAEARHVAYEQARIKGPDLAGYPDIGDMFLEAAAAAVRGYGLLFALVTVALAVLAWQVRKIGATTGTQAAAMLLSLLYLPLLMAASTLTPFFLGDTDENVNQAITEGPVWYVPAIRTICACSAATLMAGIVLLIRKAPAPH
ncbi:hypothetical protein EDD27_0928 [Nonomuraea polychroma]|uniref:Uncharacterized protein n=1 Tax=Nonomuraea polychroma TaxID=46176 RepID=A0A438LYK2_9ACTN|nr:hypothetical protein EDD27_0928 [Nonomuraea polychroma]